MGIYLHEFTDNEREIFQYSEFIVCERVQVNPDKSRAMSVKPYHEYKIGIRSVYES